MAQQSAASCSLINFDFLVVYTAALEALFSYF